MFDLIIHRRDAAADGATGRGVKKWQLPDEEVHGIRVQMKDQPPFLVFDDANTHTHFLAMDTIREVELIEHR